MIGEIIGIYDFIPFHDHERFIRKERACLFQTNIFRVSYNMDLVIGDGRICFDERTC